VSRPSGAAFGRGGLRVGPVGYGTAALGNLYTALDDETWRACVPAAWQAGIRYFDTAPHYGLGLAERRLGESLAGLPRDEYLVSTKVGRLLAPNTAFQGERDNGHFDVPATHTRVRDHSADGVRRSLDDSLDRLGLDRVDVVYVHDPEEHYRQTLDAALPTLDELRREGVIGAYGVGMNEPGLLADFIRNSDLDVVMIAGCLTLLDQTALLRLVPEATQRGVSIAAAGVFNSGILATEAPGSGSRYGYEPASPTTLAKARRIADICSEHGVTLPEAAAQFPLRFPAVKTVVLGAASAAEIRRNASLLDRPAPEELWDRLGDEGVA
jgi:D-threo-aldose 1-dehydrogenase